MPQDPFAAFRVKAIADEDPFAAFRVKPVTTPTSEKPPSKAGWYQGVTDLLPSAETLTNALPAIGGAVGGLVGGAGGTVLGMGVGGVPGAIGGATVGGAAGESAKQLVNRARGIASPDTMSGAAASIGTQGAIQGAAEAAGAGLVKGATKAAPWLMNRALNLTDKLAREFPGMSDTMIEHALTVTQGGLEKARGLLRSAKAEANAALDSAAAKGATVPITAVTDGLTNTLEKVINSGDIEGGMKALIGAERRMMAGRGPTLTMREADILKTSLQTQSKALYTAAKMGGRPNTSVHAQAVADMAQSLNAAIDDIATQAGAPGYKLANADAREMIGAVRGIEKGTRPGSNLYQAMVRPGVGAAIGGLTGAETGGTKGAIAGSVVGGALTSPAGMSRLAVLMTQPSFQALLKQSPRVSAALMQLFGQESR